jgi:hypothetical protein
MGRTKGSKNKSKEEVKEVKDVEIIEKIDDCLCNQGVPCSCVCGHEESKHYGTKQSPKLKWCNHPGCECQNYNE